MSDERRMELLSIEHSKLIEGILLTEYLLERCRDKNSLLRAENERLREALRKIGEYSLDPITTHVWNWKDDAMELRKIAQEALK